MDATQRVAEFVDALLAGHRPRRFPVEPEDAEALRAAAALAAGRAAVDAPSARFVTQLHGRLAEAADQPSRVSGTRRRFLGRLGLPAAAALLGAAVASGLRAATDHLALDADNDDEIVPVGTGVWMPVIPVASLVTSQPVRFTVGPIVGYLVPGERQEDLHAISAVCTHMGCVLDVNPDAGRLDCPCHGASFSLNGSPLSTIYPRPLPRLRVRVNDDMVEVYASAAKNNATGRLQVS